MHRRFVLSILMTLLTHHLEKTVEKSAIKSQPVEHYFSSIKNKPEALRSFFWEMPKGGDIHHHFLGSVFAEDYLQVALKDELWINPKSYQLYFDQTDALAKKAGTALPLAELLAGNPSFREEIIDHWSVRNHVEKGRDGHHWFFATFEKFLPAAAGNEPQLLSELCRAAAAENVRYLETMIEVPSILERVAKMAESKDWNFGKPSDQQFQEWYGFLEENDIDQWAGYNAEVMDHWHKSTDKHGIHLKFQTPAFRIFPHQGVVFAHLILAFKTAALSKNVLGINLVAPEDHQVSLANYKTHMAMIRYLGSKFPEVKVSLHAGELVEYKGDAREHDLKYHIDEAVTVARAQRIGHGVDIHSETRKDELLQWMKAEVIAVEINLESNEVILESKPETHPLTTYLEAGVPVCISSDDAAILRSDLTHQYELLVKYIPEISYAQVKNLVRNSIAHSFLNPDEKAREMARLQKDFALFESQIVSKK